MVTDVGQAILQGIEKLNARFDGVDARFDGVDARLDRVEARLDRVEARLDGVDARLDRMDERLSAIEKLGPRLDAVDTRLSIIDRRLTTLEGVVADLNIQIKTWPDMHFLSAATKRQMEHTLAVKGDVFEIKTRLKEIYQAMATEPEIRNLRDEVSGFREQSLTLDIRVGTIEGHLGLETDPTRR